MNNFIKLKTTTTWIMRAFISGCGGIACTSIGIRIVLVDQSIEGLYWIGASLLLYTLCIICAISVYRKKEIKTLKE